MKNIYIAVLFSLANVVPVIAQVSHGGQPLTWNMELDVNYGQFLRMPELDMDAIRAEDQENDRYKEFGYRFGIEHPVQFDINSHGVWTTEGKHHVWRAGIHAPEAKGISFLFTEFELPETAKLFIYDRERTHFIGAFDHTNRQANGMLATSLVYGEDVIIELQLPVTKDVSTVNLVVGQVVHAYRGLDSKFEELKAAARGGSFGTSGACNINVNCPEGDDWQVEKRSVALIVSGGFASCTGALVNNTANDGHPYFLTANHCLGGVGNWVFYFNHETPACSGSSGPTNQSVSGASVVASNGGSDFGLLEINSGNAIPASFNAEFAGWDNSDSQAAVSAATGIHHPSGDVKKICHDTDGPVHNNQGGAAVWYISEWEDGVTEGGSSGSPLFNQDHRIIGQLYGGGAACVGSNNNGQPDWYGRFGVSWDGNSASSRLRDWLDPGNTGVTTLDGYPTGAVVYNLDASSAGLQDLPENLCEAGSVTPTFVLRNSGSNTLTSCTITYSYNGGTNQTINWTGSLAQNATENVQLSSFQATSGTNTVEVTVSSPNGQADENNNNNSASESFELLLGEESLRLTLVTDNFGHETYWEMRGPNNQLLASGGNTNVGPNGAGNESAQAGDPGAYGNNETITEIIPMAGNGCYTFLIVDDYADGICCSYGNGSYIIRDGNGTVVAQGAEFEGERENEIGMDNVSSIDEVDFGHFSMYPNPNAGILNISVEEVEKLTNISITDMTGRTVLLHTPDGSSNILLDLDVLADGVYHVHLHSGSGNLTRKLILMAE